MKIADLELLKYCREHSSPVSDVLYELERETHLKTLAPQMLSGPLQGQLLSFISRMLRPRAVLEIGAFTGYATICLAQGLAEGGVLHAIEVNAELEYLIRKYIRKAEMEDKVILHIGNAEKIIPRLDHHWDLIFIDAGKNHNALYYDLVVERLRPGGIILVDNVLWSGKVLQPDQDRDTAVIHLFNEKIRADERVENLLLPLRDGLMMIRRR